MGEDILDRAGEGSLFVHDPSTGAWTTAQARGIASAWVNDPQPSLNEEIVLVYDWVSESNNAHDGFLEGAADNLFASLLVTPEVFPDSQDVNLLDKDLHFIGGRSPAARSMRWCTAPTKAIQFGPMRVRSYRISGGRPRRFSIVTWSRSRI